MFIFPLSRQKESLEKAIERERATSAETKKALEVALDQQRLLEQELSSNVEALLRQKEFTERKKQEWTSHLSNFLSCLNDVFSIYEQWTEQSNIAEETVSVTEIDQMREMCKSLEQSCTLEHHMLEELTDHVSNVFRGIHRLVHACTTMETVVANGTMELKSQQFAWQEERGGYRFLSTLSFSLHLCFVLVYVRLKRIAS